MTIAAQLTEIYFTKENWHKERLPLERAYIYHKKRYNNGDIYVYEKDGEVLGYYERYFDKYTCKLHNVYIKEDYRKGKVWKSLCKHFFDTMPENIKYIVGEKQKLGGKIMRGIINKRGLYGVN